MQEGWQVVGKSIVVWIYPLSGSRITDKEEKWKGDCGHMAERQGRGSDDERVISLILSGPRLPA